VKALLEGCPHYRREITIPFTEKFFNIKTEILIGGRAFSEGRTKKLFSNGRIYSIFYAQYKGDFNAGRVEDYLNGGAKVIG